MTCFVDTSALVAIVDSSDPRHAVADATWRRLVTNEESLVTTNYVALEASAVLQRRLGLDAVRVVHDDLLPLITVHWIDETIHETATAALLIAARRQLSLVDCSSFEVMHRLGLRDAFVFDAH